MEIDGIPERTIGKPELFRTVGAAFWRTSIVMTSMKSTTEVVRGRIYLVNGVELTREYFDSTDTKHRTNKPSENEIKNESVFHKIILYPKIGNLLFNEEKSN